MGSPVAGFNDSTRSPWVRIQEPSKAPGFSASKPSASRRCAVSFRVSFKVSTVMGSLLGVGPCCGLRGEKHIVDEDIPGRVDLPMARFVPALTLALLAAWCGTLQGGVTAAGSTAAALTLLAVLLPFRGPC